MEQDDGSKVGKVRMSRCALFHGQRSGWRLYGVQHTRDILFRQSRQDLKINPAPSSGKSSTRPMVTANKNGDVLFCWVEVQDVVWQWGEF